MSATWVTIVTGLAGSIVGAIGAYVALRKDKRDTRSQALIESEKAIEMQERQIALQEKQIQQAEEERKESREREKRLELRIEALEQDYRKLVTTVTTMGLCANAPTCQNYNPGDRRGK